MKTWSEIVGSKVRKTASRVSGSLRCVVLFGGNPLVLGPITQAGALIAGAETEHG